MKKFLDTQRLPDIKLRQQRYMEISPLSAFDELVCGFTTRYGGVSTGDYASLNLNFNRPDAKGNVIRNYTLLAQDLGISPGNMVLSHQVHGDRIMPVTREHTGMGIIRERSYHGIDGLATNEKGLMLVTHYADCVPLYFYDPVNKTIAISHSGWKGTLLGIGGKTVDFLKKEYGCDPGGLHVAFGPHIRECCFEVGEDVFEPFEEAFPWTDRYSTRKADGKWLLNLEGIITESLLTHGIDINNIYGCKICTRCHHDIFFSHRGSGGKTGTGAAFMMIRG